MHILLRRPTAPGRGAPSSQNAAEVQPALRRRHHRVAWLRSRAQQPSSTPATAGADTSSSSQDNGEGPQTSASAGESMDVTFSLTSDGSVELDARAAAVAGQWPVAGSSADETPLSFLDGALEEPDEWSEPIE